MHRDIFGILLARGTDISSRGSTVQRSERVMDYGQSCIDKVRAKPKRMPLKQRVAIPPDRLVTKRRFHDFSRLQGRDEEMKAMTIRGWAFFDQKHVARKGTKQEFKRNYWCNM